MVGLTVFVKATSLGKAMRATAQNREAAALVGVSIPRVFSVSWGISAVLAATAGILLAPLITITPDMGVIGIKGFVGAILGGYNSLVGSVLGGFLLGVIENLAGVYISTAFKDIVTFGVLLVVLVFRPAGMLDDKLKGSLSGFVGALLLRDYDLLVAFTEYNRNVIRLEPPLICERQHVDRFVDALDGLLGRGIVAIVKDFVKSQVG